MANVRIEAIYVVTLTKSELNYIRSLLQNPNDDVSEDEEQFDRRRKLLKELTDTVVS